MKLLRTNWFRVLVTLLISAVIFALLASRIDIDGARDALLHSDVSLIMLALGISVLINVVFGALKWQRILSDMDCALPFREVLAIRSGCTPFKIIFPLKSSELIKALYLKRQEKLSFGRALSSLLLDKTLNLLVTLGIFMVGLALADVAVPLILPIAGLCCINLLVFSRNTRAWFARISKVLHPRIRQFSRQLVSGFEDIGAGEKIILTGYSLIYQFSEFLTTYILLKAIGVSVPFSLILVLIPLVMIINNIPVTVLGMGTREALIVFLFADYGSPSALLGAGVLVSLVEHVVPVVIGLFFIKPFLTYFTAGEDVMTQGE